MHLDNGRNDAPNTSSRPPAPPSEHPTSACSPGTRSNRKSERTLASGRVASELYLALQTSRSNIHHSKNMKINQSQLIASGISLLVHSFFNILLTVASPFIVRWVWNSLIVKLSHLPPITVWESLQLLMLLIICRGFPFVKFKFNSPRITGEIPFRTAEERSPPPPAR